MYDKSSFFDKMFKKLYFHHHKLVSFHVFWFVFNVFKLQERYKMILFILELLIYWVKLDFECFKCL